MKDEIVLVGTTDGLWDGVTGQRIHFKGREVRSLITPDSEYLAIIDSREVWRSGSNGKWTQIGFVEAAKALCLFPTAHNLFVGTSEASLFSLRENTLEPVPSLDTVEGREDWYTPWGGPPDIRSIAADPSGIVYVNVHVGGIARSTDGGESWQPTIDIDADVHQVLYDPDSGLLLAACATGLAISSDRGESWQFHSEGLHGTYLRAVAVAGETILVTASTGPSTQRAAIYRRRIDRAESFERCRRGLPEWFSDNINTFCLSASNPRVVFGTSDGQVFLSSDRGQSWNVLAERLPQVQCVVVSQRIDG